MRRIRYRGCAGWSDERYDKSSSLSLFDCKPRDRFRTIPYVYHICALQTLSAASSLESCAYKYTEDRQRESDAEGGQSLRVHPPGLLPPAQIPYPGLLIPSISHSLDPTSSFR